MGSGVATVGAAELAMAMPPWLTSSTIVASTTCAAPSGSCSMVSGMDLSLSRLREGAGRSPARSHVGGDESVVVDDGVSVPGVGNLEAARRNRRARRTAHQPALVAKRADNRHEVSAAAGPALPGTGRRVEVQQRPHGRKR